jgi:hypothetical protein
MTAINLGYYSRSAYGLFPYTAPLALDNLGIELLMLGKIEQSMGIEVTHSRYNTGLLRILWQIASDGTVANNFLSSSDASVDKNVVNLKSDIIEQYWQTTGKTSEWFQFDVGAGLTALIDTFALIGTNLTTSAVIKLYGYGGGSSSAPGSWVSVPLLRDIPMPSNPLEENVVFIAPTQPVDAFRHFRVTIADTTNPDGFIRIGRCIAGSSTIFTTENCLENVSYKKENYKDEFSINGFTSIANNRALKKTMTLNFNNLNRLQYANYRRLMEYVAYCRDTLKAFVIVDPTEPYQFSVFSKLKTMPEESHVYISSDTSNVALSLSFDEAR